MNEDFFKNIFGGGYARSHAITEKLRTIYLQMEPSGINRAIFFLAWNEFKPEAFKEGELFSVRKNNILFTYFGLDKKIKADIDGEESLEYNEKEDWFPLFVQSIRKYGSFKWIA